jgi:enoyl-CoA hydratase/carnithine racemase
VSNAVRTLETLAYERRDGGGWITLTRPERKNALDRQTIHDLGVAFDLARSDPEVRAVVITGTDDAFCAGADLTYLRSLGGDVSVNVDQFLRPLAALLRTVRAFPKPVIAAINGDCVAGGMEMVLCCDLVLAAQDARIADGHSRLGLLPALGGAQGLARAVGRFKAKEMLFTGASYSGTEMEAAGLVARAVPRAELETATMELVATLAQRSPGGLRRMKEMVDDGAEMPWDVAARYELSLAERHLTTDDPHEGFTAFAEGRPPRFSAEDRSGT